MEALKKLEEELRGINAEIEKICDKDPGEWTAEDHKKFDDLDADFKAKRETQTRLHRRAQMEKELSEAVVDPIADDTDDPSKPPTKRAEPGAKPLSFHERVQQRAVAVQGWALGKLRSEKGRKALTDEHRSAMKACGVHPDDKEIEIPLLNNERMRRYHESRRLTTRSKLEQRMTTTDGAGGETIPEGFMPQWELSLLAFGGMRQTSEIFRTAGGEDMPWPTTDDTSQTGELMTEGSAASTQDVATASVVFGAFKYGSKVIKVSFELMQDSAFNLMAELGRIGGTRVGRITNTHFTTGDGSSKPRGLITAAGVGVTAASATVITTDELFDLLHSVDPAYRMPGGTGWQMHDQTAKHIRTKKDQDDQYLWQPGLQAGQPDMLLGYPVTVNQDIAQIATTNKVMAFGALDKYKIREVGSVRLRVTEDRYWEEDNIGFMVVERVDGDLLDAGTDPVKVLQMG